MHALLSRGERFGRAGHASSRLHRSLAIHLMMMRMPAAAGALCRACGSSLRHAPHRCICSAASESAGVRAMCRGTCRPIGLASSIGLRLLSNDDDGGRRAARFVLFCTAIRVTAERLGGKGACRGDVVDWESTVGDDDTGECDGLYGFFASRGVGIIAARCS